MHPIQKAIMFLLENTDTIPSKLRLIGEMIGENSPQIIKYHLDQLRKRGLIVVDRQNKEVRKTRQNFDDLISIPIRGEANCGEASIFADDKIDGYLKIKKNFIPNGKVESFFALRAVGDSMDKANCDGKNIEDGDYVIAEDAKGKNLRELDKKIVVSIIDECANIKRLVQDKENNYVILMSQSNKNYPPIIIEPEDDRYRVVGVIRKVIKLPKF